MIALLIIQTWICILNGYHAIDALIEIGQSERILVFTYFGFSFYSQTYNLLAYIIMIYMKNSNRLVDVDIYKKELEKAHRKMKK